MQYSKINHLLSLHEVTTPKVTLKKNSLTLKKRGATKGGRKKNIRFIVIIFLIYLHL